MTWSVALGVFAGLGFAELLVFIAVYAWRSRWRSNPYGVAFMGLAVVLAAIFGMMLLGRLTGGLGLPVWSVAVAFFDLVIARWLVLLFRAQRKRSADTNARTPE